MMSGPFEATSWASFRLHHYASNCPDELTMWHQHAVSHPCYIIWQHLSDCPASNCCWKVLTPVGCVTKNGLYSMDAGFSASYYWGGRGGWRCRPEIVRAYTGGGITDCKEKNEKRYGPEGWGWTFVGITGPIEAGFKQGCQFSIHPLVIWFI